ncbi:MAG: helix-turn-helix transcriptional regulator [Gammaproteobacteria bacterium]|nr:helix-turn-helix transcriptional regulator [Gammaproteobacteria bacterium]
MDQLKREKSQKLLGHAANHRLSVKSYSHAVLPQQEHAWIEFANPIDREQFFYATPIDKFNFSSDSHLSKRELACARLFLQGNRAKAIAAQLHISPRTVEGHLANLKNKLNCANQSQLFKKLVEIGLTF